MEKLLWEIRQNLSIRSTALFATVMALLFAVVFTLLSVLPAQKSLSSAQQLYRLEAEAHALALQQKAASKAGAEVFVLPVMPSSQTLPQWLSRMFAIAREEEVVLDIGEYRYSHGKDEPFGRYQIEIPMTADYPTLRVFLARVMNEMPFVSLDDLSISRGMVSDEAVDARIKMTIFLTEGSK